MVSCIRVYSTFPPQVEYWRFVPYAPWDDLTDGGLVRGTWISRRSLREAAQRPYCARKESHCGIFGVQMASRGLVVSHLWEIELPTRRRNEQCIPRFSDDKQDSGLPCRVTTWIHTSASTPTALPRQQGAAGPRVSIAEARTDETPP